MNKTFKVIFNRARGTLMVANEITRSVQKKSTKTVLATAVALALTSTSALAVNGEDWTSETLPTKSVIDLHNATAADDDIYGVRVSDGAKGTAVGETQTDQTTKFTIDIDAYSAQGVTIERAVFGILSQKAKAPISSGTEKDPSFGGNNLSVTVQTDFTGGVAAAATTKYLKISADAATLGAYASNSNSYGVTATNGGRVDLGSSNSTTITSQVNPSNYSDSAKGNAYGIYADGKDSAATPTYSQVNLASKTAVINAFSTATHATGSAGVAVGVQIANGATVHAENTAADSTLTINGESLSTAVLIGVNSIGSTGIFNHANTTINLNTAANVTTAAVNATGIAVSNSTGVSTVTVGGNLTENVRSDTATATGISVDNNVATTGEGTTNTGVTVKGNTDITVTTKTGTAYGVDLDGYENTTTSSDKNYPAYVDFLGKTTEIKAKAEGYGDNDTPAVTGVNVTKGSVNFISRNDDKTVVADSQVKITATGKATDKTLAINANDDGVVTLNANKIEITSAGDGIKVNDDSHVYAVAGTLSSSNNTETLSFKDGSSISITSHDNAVKATDDSVVTLYAEDVDITVTGVLADAPTAVTLSDSSFVIGGKTISITSEGGTGIQAIDNGHVTIRSDYKTENTAVEGSSITINAYNEAIHAKKGTVGASTVNLYSETIDIEVDGDRKTGIDAIILENGEHSIVGKTTSIKSTGNGMEVLEGAKVSVVDFDMAATSPTKFTEGSSLRIESNDEALYVNNASKVTLAASSVTLLSSTQLGTVQVENSGTLGNDYFAEGADAAKLTTVTINAKDLTVRNTYSSGSEGGFGGATFVAHSNTKLDVTADTLEVNAHNGQGDVVRVYGNAQVSITGGQLEDAEEGSSLAGNIVFAPETDGTADKKGTEAKVTLSLSGEDSEWAGRSYINNDTTSGGTTPTHGNTGNLYVNNTSLDVTLQDGATWTVTGNSFFNTINLYKGIVDASSESVKNFIGAGEGTEAGLIAVHGAKNELYINEDADIAGLHVAMMAQGADYGKPELIVDTVTAFDIKTTVDGTITEASNRLTFVTKDGVTEKGMLTIEEAFSINSTAFNATAGNDTQNEAIEHYNFLQGTLVTQNSATAEVETQLRLNKIQGELDSDGKAVGALLVKSGNRVDVMPYTTEDGAEEGKEKAASTALGTLTLEKGASFYATNNDSVTATKIETNTTGSSESQALVRIESTNADSDKRTVTTIGTLELATKDTFEAINNKSVKITTATVGEDANLTIKDVKLASASDDKVTPVTETEITTLNVQKGKFLADKNKSVKLETVNVASVDANPSEASVNVTNSEEVTVTTLNVGDNAKVSATGNTSVVIDYVKAGSTLTDDTGTGASANIVLQNNTDVTVKNIATGASATVTVTENTNTAQIGDRAEDNTLTGVISLGSKSTLTAQDASLYAKSVTLADGESDSAKTKLEITGDAKDLTDGHYDNVKVSVTDLNLGNNSEVTLTNNKEVAITNVNAGSGITGVTGSNGTKAKMEVTGSENVTVDHLNLGQEATFDAKSNATVTVKNIETAASATVTVTENTNTAQIGDRTGETLTGVISLGSKSTLTAQDASLYAKSVTLADGDDTTKTKLVITGDAKDLTDGHYDNVTVAVTDLNLGNNSEVTLANNKEVAITNVNAGSGITGATDSNGTKAKMEVTGSENVTVDHLNLGQEATFDAKSNATVTVKNIETAASATVTVTENTNTAQIGDRTGETLTGVISLGSKSTLTAQDASLYATSVTLADGESDSAKTKLVITGDTKDATDSHYNNVTVAVTDLKLGNYSEVTLANNKSVTVGTITGATTGATATGDNAIVSITGSESVSIDSLKLGKKGTFIAQGNADVTVKAIETVAASSAENAATITIGGTEDATKNSNTAQIGSITLGDHTTMTATNAVVGEQANAVDVTVASNAKFTLTSEKATSYINNFDVNGEFTVSDATVNVQDLKGAGKVNVGVATTEGSNTTHTGANMYVKKLSMTGGSIYVDPVYGSTSVLTVDELNNGTLDTNITAGYGALVTIGAGSAESAIEAVKANVEAQTQVTNLTNAKSIVYISTPVTLGDNGSITVDPKATAAATNKLESDGTVSSDSVNKTVNVNNGGAIVVDQAAIGSGTVFSDAKAVTVVGQSDDATPVQSTLAVINVVAGSTLKLTDVENAPVTGNIVALTDSPYVTASVSSDHKTVSLTGTATDTGLSVIASMGVQSMLRRADMVLAESVADHAFATLDYTKGIGLWADVRGEQYKQTSLGHGAGFKTDIAYGTVGAEFAPTDATSLGVAFQYGKGTVKGDLYSVKNKTKNYGATIYGSTMIGATGVKLVGEVAYLKSDNEITNTYYTGLNQDLDADIFSAGLTVQKSFKLGSFDVTPSLGVRVSKLKTDDMRAGYSTIEEQSQTLVQIPVAVRFSTKGIETTGGWNIRPNLKLAVVPTFGDKDIEVYGNKRTVIDGSPFQGALGVNFTKGNFSINATANAGAGQHGSKAFGGKVGVNYRF